MSGIKTGGPAFPAGLASGHLDPLHPGATLRDYFAAKAMQGMLSNGGVYSDDSRQPPVNLDGWKFKECAACAYEMADAMLAAREKGGAK